MNYLMKTLFAMKVADWRIMKAAETGIRQHGHFKYENIDEDK